MAATKRLRSFSGQAGENKGARLARWLCTVLERLANEQDAGPTPEVATRVADAHLALSGGVWLYRRHGVDLDRYLRYRLVEAVLVAVEDAEPALAKGLGPQKAIDENLLTRSTAAFAMTVFSSYAPERVARLSRRRGGVQILYDAIRAARNRGGHRWQALLKLASTMGLKVMRRRGEGDPAENLRQDVLRIRRLIRDGLGAAAYRTLPPEIPISFAIDP